MPTDHRELTASEREWLDIRDYLREHRHSLAVSAADDCDGSRVASTPLLTIPTWLPPTPLPFDSIDLEWSPDAPFAGVAGSGTEANAVLPLRADGQRYRSYSETIGALAAPKVFQNRPTYRLIDADLSGPRGRMVFTQGTYFDGIDTSEAAAHEYAARQMGLDLGAGVRSAIGDPCDLARRPTNIAISTLTIRHDRERREASFFLHWRDPAKVGHAGGLYQVIPVGIFQASGDASWNERNDFSLWRNMIRELAEELLDESEEYGSEQAPIDYESWPFAAHLTESLRRGDVRAYCLGLGVDPLTFATDLLSAVVIDAPLFDGLFGNLAANNEEGHVLDAKPFDDQLIESIVQSAPIQAAGAATLTLASRAKLLDQ